MSNYQKVIDLVNQLAGKKDWSTQIYITITQDALAGLLLDRIVWWSDKGNRSDGFFWKTTDEWEAELCLSYAQIARLTKNLRDMGLIETTRKKAHGAPTIHYKPVMEAIENLIKSKFEKVEIRESRNSRNGNFQFEESQKSLELQESSKSITAKTINNNQQDSSTEGKPKKNSTEKQLESQAMFKALAELCQYDLSLITGKERGKLNQTEKKLREGGRTPDDLKSFEKWWYEHDWRGKQGQPPNTGQILESWGQYKNYLSGGNGRDSPPKPKFKIVSAQDSVGANSE